MDAIRLGIVGAEAFGNSTHRPIIDAQPDRFQIVALYDSAPIRGAGWATRTHAAAYESLDDMLANRQVEAVFIASDIASGRFDAALRAVNSERHVILDPPMAGTSAQCDQLIQRSRQKGVLLTVAHLRRWDHSIVHALSRIQSGEVGEPQLVKLSSNVAPQRDAMTGDGFHLFDYALLMNRSMLLEVSAAPNASGYGPIDTASVLLRFERPPAVELTFSVAFPSAPSALARLVVIGSRSAFADTSILDAPNPQPFYDGVWSAIRQRGAPPVLASGARNAVYVAECAVESARKGQSVRADRLLKAVE